MGAPTPSPHSSFHYRRYKWADVVYDVSDPVNPKVVHYKVGMKDQTVWTSVLDSCVYAPTASGDNAFVVRHSHAGPTTERDDLAREGPQLERQLCSVTELVARRRHCSDVVGER